MYTELATARKPQIPEYTRCIKTAMKEIAQRNVVQCEQPFHAATHGAALLICNGGSETHSRG